jgi:hypothetical protein
MMIRALLLSIACLLWVGRGSAGNIASSATGLRFPSIPKPSIRVLSSILATASISFSGNIHPTIAATFISPDDKSITFQYPEGVLEESPKLVKTHDKEVYFKGIDTKGFSFGYTVGLTLRRAV